MAGEFDYIKFKSKMNSFGVKVDEEKLPTDAEEEAKYLFEPDLKIKLLLGFAVAFLCGAIALAPIEWAMKAFWLLFLMISYVISVVDIRARMIPFELCGIVLVLGAVYHFLFFGKISLALTLVIAIIVYIGFKGAERVFAMLGARGSIGGGDLRLIVPIVIAVGPLGAIYGLCVMVVCAAVFCIGGGLLKKVTRKTHIPLGPFLCIWLMTGLILPVVAG